MNIKKFAIILLAAALITGGVFWLLSVKKIIPSGTVETEKAVPAAETQKMQDTDGYKQMAEQWKKDMETISMTDMDADGLTNEQEKQYGTDPESADTDKDGLFDKSEIEIYKTDPLKADTDGDSYKDGAEVRKGYNPNGPGRMQ